jgi:D-alanyl-D-alanine carboxypeptidase/D-alanyl-D-alanine-endopeptidase (penicillin-binding protein 4)
VAEGEQDDAPPRSRRRRALSWLPDVAVLALVLLAFASWQLDLGTRWGLSAPDPLTQPELVAPPEGLQLPPLRAAPAVATPLDSAAGSSQKVRAALLPLLGDRRLGKQVDVLVTDLATGKVVYRHGARSVTPASTMKLLTSVAALESIGPETRFHTTVRRVPGSNRIVLVGGGDPLLASKPADASVYPDRADIVTLARRTAKALERDGTTKVRLSYDDSLFAGPAVDPHWPGSYLTEGVVPPITALWVDEGKATDRPGYVADPSLSAAQAFRAALAKAGVTVVNQPVRRIAPPRAHQISGVASAPLGQVVARLLLVSDNNAAEVVAHHVGIQQGHDGSFVGGVAGVRQVLRGLGVPLRGAVINDGSGLSRQDRLDPATLAAVLRVAAAPDQPDLRQVLTGLPVAGFTGSLEFRFDLGARAGRGRVQAKTGTLTGVHGLAGVATDLDGDVFGFVAIADQVPEADQLFARVTIDKVAAALGACHCSRPDAG